MNQILEFEKPVYNLRNKINELSKISSESDIDLEEEIATLERRLARLEKDIYTNLRPWNRVQIARHQERPTTLDYIHLLFDDFIEFHGDRYFGDDGAIISGLAHYHGNPITIIGHQRGKNTKENIARNFGMPHPEGYRKAIRHMKLAEKYRRPIITFIDTKGAEPGRAAEERGQSEAIAYNLKEMAGLTVPIISVVIGEGGSGGALALGVANHLHMLENSTYSVISPEGAASILWKDAKESERAAESMRITAQDLKELDVVDEIISEPLGGAHRNVEEQAAHIDRALTKSLLHFANSSPEELLEARWKKFSQIGKYIEG
ncbi:MAG TPA: acetyl-CoA carboxylase carboxyl transferase subunit alpha [Pseudogracilibacillus sp.]|nr:acetyl-CoA carboxylase carboxyl transferase subunit alpha [Pseudogracilibacillus sp.]